VSDSQATGDGQDDASGDSGHDVDYRAVPQPFAGLRAQERRVAWAIVRALATAAWWTGGVLAVAWLFISGINGSFRPMQGLPALAALVAAVVLEVQANALRAGPS
jgi:hypothetical protein